jgi:hypothetical protein
VKLKLKFSIICSEPRKLSTIANGKSFEKRTKETNSSLLGSASFFSKEIPKIFSCTYENYPRSHAQQNIANFQLQEPSTKQQEHHRERHDQGSGEADSSIVDAVILLNRPSAFDVGFTLRFHRGRTSNIKCRTNHFGQILRIRKPP